MSYTIRPITAAEYPAYVRTVEAPFGNQPSAEDLDIWRPMHELDRSLAVFDAGQIVASTDALSLELTLPGLTRIPAPGVTRVGVLPTHRRRGLLRALMRRQIDDLRQRGEILAILTASESVIYGRFGYGVATSTINVEIERAHAAFARPWNPPGQLTLVDHASALDLLPTVYERARGLQPGAVSRGAAWWQATLRNPSSLLDGMGPRFYVTYTAPDGQVDGFAHYRIQRHWDQGLPSSALEIGELIAVTTQARAALWQFCFGVDLIKTVRARSRPVDEPLRWMLADPRRLRVTALNDDLFVRLLDIPRALAARRYHVPGQLVLAVDDAFCPENSGRYALEGGPEGATCRPSTADPDLALSVTDLAATYLGGVSFSALARAGRVEAHASAALDRADAMFAVTPAPWCATPF